MEVTITKKRTYDNAIYRPEYAEEFDRLLPTLLTRRRILKITADTRQELDDCLHTFIAMYNNKNLPYRYSIVEDPEIPNVAYFRIYSQWQDKND